MAEFDELRDRVEQLERDMQFLLKREKALFDDYTRLSQRIVDCGSVTEKRLTRCEDDDCETRETIDLIMDKVFPDHCTYVADIDRALKSPPKPKG